MPYNYRLKSYGNGTAQLTFFNRPILNKDDKYKNMPATYLDYMNDLEYGKYSRNYGDDEDEQIWTNEIVLTDDGGIDVLPAVECIKSPFGDYIPEYLLPPIKKQYETELTDEELAERHEHSIKTSLNRSKKKIYDYGRSNIWEWFITLTFERVESFNAENFDECKKRVSKWFQNVRIKYCPKIKYLAIPEQHESGAWHFHCLVSNCDELDFEVARNNRMYRIDEETGEYILDKYGARIPNKYYGKELRTSYPDGEYIYNIKQYRNGFSTATKITDTRKAVSYVIKYVTKEIAECGFGKRRYLPSTNLKLPIETVGLLEKGEIKNLITEIEYKFGLQLSIDAIKTYKLDVPNYENSITVFEFDFPRQLNKENAERKPARLNEIMEEWYG